MERQRKNLETRKSRYVLARLQKGHMDTINMENISKVAPPDHVRGMTQLRREAFTNIVKIPSLKIPKCDISKTQKTWKPFQLKLRELKPIVELSDNDPEKKTHCLILLDPEKLQIDTLSENQKLHLQKLGLDIKSPETFEVKLHYNNWTLSDIMRAVLPGDADIVTSYTQVGHIAHVNLKAATLPYKSLIGEVIVDKIPTVKTVVNKLGSIDNTYRNFQMELLAGEENYITQIKEHNCIFELDFSKVYWNSRLGTEHQRIVDLIEKDSIVYDVFAGIGPFAVPLAKKRQCVVFANDLNPSSFEYLKRNIQLNKCSTDRIKTFNLDGHDFIQSVIKNDLIERITKSISSSFHNKSTSGADDSTQGVAAGDNSSQVLLKITKEDTEENGTAAVPRSYVIMNLPAMAIDFLESFKSLLQDVPPELKLPDVIEQFLPHVFCYSFTSKNVLVKDVQAQVEMILGQPLPGSCDVRIVRNVAPNKEMVCVSFKLWTDLVLTPGDHNKKDVEDSTISDTCKEPENKRQKLSS